MSEKLKAKSCLVIDCSKPLKRGDRYCSMHRARLTRTGRLDKKSAPEVLAMALSLLPCPFCGTTEYLFVENREERGGDYISDHVVCGMCGAVHLKDDDLGWNNRPTEKAAREEVLEMLSSSKCLACRGGDKPYSDGTGWWHDRDDKPRYICHGADIRQAYQERFHEQG